MGTSSTGFENGGWSKRTLEPVGFHWPGTQWHKRTFAPGIVKGHRRLTIAFFVCRLPCPGTNFKETGGVSAALAYTGASVPACANSNSYSIRISQTFTSLPFNGVSN